MLSPKIYPNFMVPKPSSQRLLINMQTMSGECQTWTDQQAASVLGSYKESQLKLSLETRNFGDVVIVHCQGRIVYRDEAAALSRVVGEVLG